MIPQWHLGQLWEPQRTHFISAPLTVKRRGRESRSGMCSLQPTPDAVLALQLAPPGPETHAAMMRAGLGHRGFRDAFGSGGFGVGFDRFAKAGSSARVVCKGTQRPVASHADFSLCPFSPQCKEILCPS